MSFVLSLRTIFIALIALVSTFAATVFLSTGPQADMHITPVATTLEIGQRITLDVIVKSNTPANAFTGEVLFDNTRFVVDDISYNTSIANLWVTEPWYSRADNSIYFAGGTTQPGGFTGSGVLLRITLRAFDTGDTTVTLADARILAHDGLGSDLALQTPIDAVFTATGAMNETFIEPADKIGFVSVIPPPPPLDINNDGSLSFQDISVLLLNLSSDDSRYDFNGDGLVDWSDVGTWQRLRASE